MMSFSMVWVNSATLLGFSYQETVRENIATSEVVIYEVQVQIT